MTTPIEISNASFNPSIMNDTFDGVKTVLIDSIIPSPPEYPRQG